MIRHGRIFRERAWAASFLSVPQANTQGTYTLKPTPNTKRGGITTRKRRRRRESDAQVQFKKREEASVGQRLNLDLALCECEDATVTPKQKRAYLKKAAGYVADLILDSLEGLPEEERQARLKQVHASLSGGAGKHSKRPKRSSKRASPQLSRRSAAHR